MFITLYTYTSQTVHEPAKDSSVRLLSSSYCFQFPPEVVGLEKPATIFLPNLVSAELLTTLRGAPLLPFSNQMALPHALNPQ